jgi:hypothetical protein
MKFNSRLLFFTILLTAIATACKFFFGPDIHFSGFSPIIAIALFSGMIMKQKDASFLLPLLALVLSDLAIQIFYTQGWFPYEGMYSGQWKNYLILLSCTLIGWALKGKNYSNLIAGTIAAPTIFFLISNFGVWMGPHITYTKDFNGLLNCYIAGLPFYKNSLIATVLFLPAILFSYNFLLRQKKELRLA